jgi:hypothetical protein
VRKEVLLHGTYDDYIKEYKSRSGGVSGGSSGSKGQPSMADVAAAYQKALTQVASALQHQGSSSKVGTTRVHYSDSTHQTSLHNHCTFFSHSHRWTPGRTLDVLKNSLRRCAMVSL